MSYQTRITHDPAICGGVQIVQHHSGVLGQTFGGGLTLERFEDIEKDHGRIWTRRYTWINDVSWMDKSMRDA